ncbi:MAG: alkaline phosphatase family protein, partial [Deltaproteobacteria bacterium]|nr:alkaline phosphatase family protein [Deltaproteobacteria bacterium]
MLATLKMRFIEVCVLVLVAGPLPVLMACSRDAPPEPRVPGEARSPLLLFAIDGLEWSVILPLLADGRLPVIADLMQRGSFGHLESMLPTYSAVIWTSI